MGKTECCGLKIEHSNLRVESGVQSLYYHFFASRLLTSAPRLLPSASTPTTRYLMSSMGQNRSRHLLSPGELPVYSRISQCLV